MKKFLVIGNPIEHSLSPKLHNYWIKKNKIDAVYDKKLINKENLEDIILQIKKGEIKGINVTVPYKKSVIPFIEKLTSEANTSQSVNTIYMENEKITGHNTDIAGFELGLRHLKYDVKNKKIFILGAGGVVPSIIISLKKMKASKIILCNRTKKKAEDIKKLFKEIEIVDWANIPKDINMIINATSIGLKKYDDIKLDYDGLGSDKLYYDVIYNPRETNFLKKARMVGNRAENGKMMFIYQAHQAFTIWHNVMPKIDDEVINLLEND